MERPGPHPGRNRGGGLAHLPHRPAPGGTESRLAGGVIFLTGIGFFVLHLLILTDHLVTLSLLAALYGLLRWEDKPGFRWMALFFLAMVAGFLSKGFIGLVFPGLIGLLYAWYLRERRLLGLLFSPGGIILAAVLLVAWGWATETANPGWLKFQIVNEQIMRFLGRREPADVNSFTIAGFYVFLFIWLMPWTFILPSALYRFWPATRPGREVGAAGRLLLIWVAVILGFFTLSSSRIEYYSLPALPALALILGWRVQRYLDTPGDRLIPWTLLVLGLLGLSLLVLLPYLEQVCVGNRREFLGMVSLISPLARQATWIIPAVTLAGVLAAWLRRPRLAVGAYGLLAVALAWFTFQTMTVLTPLMSDRRRANISGGWRPPTTSWSWVPSKSLSTGPPWNITPAATSSWSKAPAVYPNFPTRCLRPRTTSSLRNACGSCGRDPEKSFCFWTIPPRRSHFSKAPPQS